MSKSKNTMRHKKTSRRHKKTSRRHTRKNKKGGIMNPFMRFKKIPDIQCSPNGKTILNKQEVEPFLDEMVKYNHNDWPLKNYYLVNCGMLKQALDLWNNPEAQKSAIDTFNLGPYIPGKRRLYSFLQAYKNIKSR